MRNLLSISVGSLFMNNSEVGMEKLGGEFS